VKTGLKLGLLALVALILGVAYFLLARDTAPAKTGFLFTFPASDRLDQIRIVNQRGTVQLAREDGKWVITEPGHYRASQDKARLMESLLLAVPIKRQLDSSASEYGFANPQATVEMTSTTGIRKALAIGNLTASKAQVYLMDKDSGDVFVADLGSVGQFDGSLDAYRDKDIFSVDKNNIVEFSYYEDGEKKLTASRTGEGSWQLTYPYASPARAIEINQFLVALRKWSAAMYPPRTQLDSKALGLDAPRQVLEVTDAKGQKQRLELGAEAGGLRYVRSGSQEDVAGIFAVDVDFSNINPGDLVFYQPLQTTIGQVASIELNGPGVNAKFVLDHGTEQPTISANGKTVPYEDFVSLFVKYIGLAADGFDAEARPGTETLKLTTTYLDGSTAQVALLERDTGSKYMQANGQAGFYLSDEKVGRLLDRLDAALAAGQ
jgi:hypothetical protein